MPMRSSEPTAKRTCSTSPPATSHRLAISFMKLIFVASRALDAYLTISALFGLMRWMRLRWRLYGEYRRSNRSKAWLSSVPITMRSGLKKSFTASPSFKNSGLLTTLMLCLAKRSTTARTFSLVPTGTVLFSTSTTSCSAALATCSATPSTYERSADPSSCGGVPTATNTTSRLRMPSVRLEVKSSRCGQLRLSKSAKRGSKNGTSPARSLASLASFTSIQTTLVPESAKQAPATNPTYPEPTTAIFTAPLVASVGLEVDHFVKNTKHKLRTQSWMRAFMHLPSVLCRV